MLIDEQPATPGLDPRLTGAIHRHAHRPALVDESLIVITVAPRRRFFLKDAPRNLPSQTLARRIVLPLISKECSERLLALNPESRTRPREDHVIGNVCQERIDTFSHADSASAILGPREHRAARLPGRTAGLLRGRAPFLPVGLRALRGRPRLRRYRSLGSHRPADDHRDRA